MKRIHAAFHQPTTRIYRVVQGSVWALIVLSILLLVLEAMLPDGSPSIEWLQIADRCLLVIFAIEIMLRVASYNPPTLKVFNHAPAGRIRTHVLARLAYIVRPMTLVDILAVLALFPELRGLRALRLLRLLRTMRVFRYRNPFAIIGHALEENGILFTFAFAVLGVATSLGGISLYLVEARINPSITSLADALWWALVTVTTVGYGDVSPMTLLGRIVAAVLMVAGLFILALFAGIVGSSLVNSMLSIREEQFRMSNYVNHVVVCGYDESTHLLEEALGRELDLTTTKVVMMDDHERPRDLPPDYLWVEGDPTKESELDKVRLTHAATVIVTGARDLSPQAADARTILITFTIRSYMNRLEKSLADRRRPLYLVAEVLDSENVDHAESAGADEVIETRKIGYSMIAHAIRHHGTATTMSGVLVNGSHHIYIGNLTNPPKEPVTFGDLLVALKLTKRGGLVIGVRTPQGKDIINPEKSYVFMPGTALIYLAQDVLLPPMVVVPGVSAPRPPAT